MAAIHTAPFEGAGRTYDWNGAEFIVEDYWDRLYGESWAWSRNNPAAIKYAVRIACATNIPDDNEVVYGKRGGLGHLVHVSELKAQAGS